MKNIKIKLSCKPVIPALERQRQEDYEFEVSLGYTGTLCLKKNKKKKIPFTVTSKE
jgi:hypothetical protein